MGIGMGIGMGDPNIAVANKNESTVKRNKLAGVFMEISL
jgi:hypothetical protein